MIDFQLWQMSENWPEYRNNLNKEQQQQQEQQEEERHVWVLLQFTFIWFSCVETSERRTEEHPASKNTSTKPHSKSSQFSSEEDPDVTLVLVETVLVLDLVSVVLSLFSLKLFFSDTFMKIKCFERKEIRNIKASLFSLVQAFSLYDRQAEQHWTQTND